jgi:hypothetical protein
MPQVTTCAGTLLFSLHCLLPATILHLAPACYSVLICSAKIACMQWVAALGRLPVGLARPYATSAGPRRSHIQSARKIL